VRSLSLPDKERTRLAPCQRPAQPTAARRRGVHSAPAVVWNRSLSTKSTPGADEKPSLWVRIKTKALHVKEFLISYKDGFVLFYQEIVVARKLLWRIYGENRRSVGLWHRCSPAALSIGL
jgi:hypothetical protein